MEKNDFRIFASSSKMVPFFIKSFIFLMSFPIIFLLFCTVAGVVVGVVFIFEGVIFIGPVICLVSVVPFLVGLFSIFYNFIVNHRTSWRKLFIIFIASATGFGIGAGISVLEFSKMTVSSEAPVHVESSVKRETFEMKENTVLSNLAYDYIVDDSLGDLVQVEAIYYDVFTEDVVIEEDEDTGYIYIHTKMKQSINLGELYNILMNDLKDKRLSNYSALGQFKFKVYASEDNIDKLQKNQIKMYVPHIEDNYDSNN